VTKEGRTAQIFEVVVFLLFSFEGLTGVRIISGTENNLRRWKEEGGDYEISLN